MTNRNANGNGDAMSYYTITAIMTKPERQCG